MRLGFFFGAYNAFEIVFVMWMVPIVVRINEAANTLEDLIHDIEEDEEVRLKYACRSRVPRRTGLHRPKTETHTNRRSPRRPRRRTSR